MHERHDRRLDVRSAAPAAAAPRTRPRRGLAPPRLLALMVALSLAGLDVARAQTVIARVNCGGPALVLPNGASFTADAPWTGEPSSGYVGGAAVPVVSGFGGALVGGWQTPYAALHATAREGWQAYRFDGHSGSYVVRLHLAEIILHGPGLRQFDLSIEGVPVLVGTDLAAEHGVQYTAAITTLVQVADDRLDVESGGPDPALLSGIEIRTAPPAFTAPAVPTGFAIEPGYQRNILVWDESADPFVAGTRVYRASSPGGPFLPVATTPSLPARYHDDDVVPGAARFYRIAHVGVSGLEGPTGPVLSATPYASADSPLAVHEITIDPEDLEVIDELVLLDPDQEVPAVFTHDGVSHDVEVRYRGGGSRTYSKKSWKVKFPPAQEFQGLSDLNLKAHFGDLTLLREPLANDLMVGVGHAAPNHEPVHLLVNGVYRGVFNVLEQVETDYLQSRDRDTGTSIYKCEANFAVLADPSLYELLYEKKTNTDTGHDDLIELIEFVDAPGPDFERELVARFDVDDYLGYLAVVGFVADADTVRHNYFMLNDHSLGRWELVAWDTDNGYGADTVGQTVTLPVDFGTPDAGSPAYNWLKTRVLDVPSFRWRYAEKLRALIAAGASPAAHAPHVAELHALIATDAAADVHKQGWESDEAFLAGPGLIDDFVVQRGAFLLGALDAYQPPTPPTGLWINEYLADNLTGATDEAGDHEDWVELYNASAATIDASGMYLTDDLDQPTLWALPAGSLVPAGGHLLVWADKEPAEGPLHADLKLGKAGEVLALFAADGTTLLDFRHFRPQLPDVSEGRTTDGGPFFARLGTPTPGAPNTTAGNLPPWITWVEHDPAFVTASDTVTVTCKVSDAGGVAGVTLAVSVDGAPFTMQPMQAIGADRWEASVGPHADGTLVEYWIGAQDDLGANAAKPGDAPDEVFAWVVSAPEPAGVRVNEVMADNDGVLADEAGDFDDWIELHNTTRADVDVGGWHLADDLGDPTQWMLPAGTTIPAGGHLLVWADDEAAQGPLHANFKLGAGGEEVGLFAADGTTLVDTLAFGPQQTDVAFGRMPDGGDALVTLLDASPGAPNQPVPGGHARYDLGNLDGSGVALDGTSPAQAGTIVGYAVSSAPPASAGLMVIGLAPLTLGAGAKGTLLAELFVLLPFTTDGAGTAELLLPIPASPLLDGFPYFLQPYVGGAGLGQAVATTLSG